MKEKTLLRSLWIAGIAVLVLTIGAFTWKFHDHIISQDVANWGQFGDYVGGILNPLLSLLNLIVLAYLTIRITRYEDKRNEFTLQELARPLGEISFYRDELKLKVTLSNCGLGPLILKKIEIENSEGVIFPDFKEVLKVMTDLHLRYETFSIHGDSAVIGKEREIDLLSLYPQDGNLKGKEQMDIAKRRLNEMRITIYYSDIYNRPMNEIREKLHT